MGRRRRRHFAKKPEERIHVRAVELLEANGIPHFHPPNESMAPVQYRAKLRAMGVSSGVSDLIIVSPTSGGEPGAALELKAGANTPTDEQTSWLHRFRCIGFAATWTQGHREAADQLCDWGYITPTQRDHWIAEAEVMGW